MDTLIEPVFDCEGSMRGHPFGFFRHDTRSDNEYYGEDFSVPFWAYPRYYSSKFPRRDYIIDEESQKMDIPSYLNPRSFFGRFHMPIWDEFDEYMSSLIPRWYPWPFDPGFRIFGNDDELPEMDIIFPQSDGERHVYRHTVRTLPDGSKATTVVVIDGGKKTVTRSITYPDGHVETNTETFNGDDRYPDSDSPIYVDTNEAYRRKCGLNSNQLFPYCTRATVNAANNFLSRIRRWFRDD